ncbi:MAG: NUDIX hydrolase [Synergistaceae bacterium]|nr:NUDIX hydrolase [Synergistaceae bacterium]
MAHPLRNIIETKKIYSGHILDLIVDRVKFPSGQIHDREVVLHKSAVAILPINDKGNFLLIKQYRHAVDEDILEIPAGLCEAGENPEESAMRELEEEIGYCGDLERVAETYSSPGFCTEKITIFLARNLKPKTLPCDDDEYITVFEYRPDQIETMIADGTIKDVKTIAAWGCYLSRLQK